MNARQLYKPRRYVPRGRPMYDPTGVVYGLIITAVLAAFVWLGIRAVRARPVVLHAVSVFTGDVAPSYPQVPTVSPHGDRAQYRASLCGHGRTCTDSGL